MTRVVALVVALTFNSLSGACGTPCDELAKIACTHTGADSEECTKLTAKAEKASPEDKEACRKALDLVEDLVKVR